LQRRGQVYLMAGNVDQHFRLLAPISVPYYCK